MSNPYDQPAEQPQDQMSGPGKPKSSGLLIAGLVFIGLALISFIVGYMGKSKMVSTANKFSEKGEGGNFKQALTVPGSTDVTLPAQKYIIWTRLKDISEYKKDDGTGFDFDKFEKPPINWSVSGKETVSVTEANNFHMNNEVAVGSFTIKESGDYQINADVVEGEITDTFAVYNDKLSQVGEAGAGLLGGGAAMILGFGCSGVLGLIGLILTLIHFVK